MRGGPGERRSGVFGVENRTIGCEASVNVYEVSVSRVSKNPTVCELVSVCACVSSEAWPVLYCIVFTAVLLTCCVY